MFELLMLIAFLAMGLSQLLPKENDRESTRKRGLKRMRQLNLSDHAVTKNSVSPRVFRSRLSPVMGLHHNKQ